MSIEAALTQARTTAETLMVDACSIRRRTGESTGPGGVITPTWDDLYAGKCRVQMRNPPSGGQDVGEAYVVLAQYEVQLPVSVTGLAEGDTVTITASALDENLVGKVFTIRGVMAKTHLTSRRLAVSEVTS